MTIEYYIENNIKLINDKLDEILKIEKPEKIYEAMRYSIFAGGKRARPILLLLSKDMYSDEKRGENELFFASALEMIHTYSLIHDDLPAMDDDDLRRGKPTSHKAFGEAIAILAGDGLLNKAYEIMTKACCANPSISNLKAMKTIGNNAGVKGMVGGQVMDITYDADVIDLNELIYIHKNKTAKLFQAAIVSGGILGGADDEEIQKLDSIGELLGIAFQVKDDILDVEGNKEKLGKNIKSDTIQNKTTYVSFLGLDKAKEEYENICNDMTEKIKSLTGNTEMFRKYIDILIDRDL